MIILYIIVLAVITLLILAVLSALGIEDDHQEGPIPTPYFPDQVTATPST
jgi:hypothetical protein